MLLSCPNLHQVLSVLLLLVVSLISADGGGHARCIDRRGADGRHRSRNFYYNGQSLPIRIEVSDRPSHQLISRVLRILLRDEVGYSKVELISVNDDIRPTVSLGRFSRNEKNEDDGPEVMINLELWLPPGFRMEDWVKDDVVINGGPLGALGRFGWFMSSSAVNKEWNTTRAIVDHWKALRLPEVTGQFAIPDRERLRTVARNGYLDTTFCDYEKNAAFCQDGYFHADQCHSHHRCATLYAGNPDFLADELTDQIQSLRLNVNVAWLGSNLDSFILDESKKSSDPLLLFNWIPNVLTSNDRYSRIHFPFCEDPEGGCDFEVHQLTKIMWPTLRTHTPEVHHIVTHLQFSPDDLDQLLQNYVTNLLNARSGSSRMDALEKTACEWIRNNKEVWNNWLPGTLDDKPVIYLGGMFPLTGPIWRQPAIVPGAQMAIEYINNDPAILGDYELKMLVSDTQCKVDIAMKSFLEYVVDKTRPIAGILGPGCSETAEPIAGVSKHFNTIVVSYSAETLQLANRAVFPLFFRTIPQMFPHGDIYIEMFRRWKWEQVALLAEDGQNFPEYHAFLKDLFQRNSIQVAYDRKMPRQARSEDASKLLDELKRKDVKIVIMTSFEQAARSVMCQAYRKGMTIKDGYVWFLPSWFTQHWWDFSAHHGLRHYVEPVSCTVTEMLEAVQSHIFLNNAFLGPEDSWIAGNTTTGNWNKMYSERVSEIGLDYSIYASYAYDAVFVFALGLDKLLNEDPSALESLHTDATVQKFMSYLNNTNFNGASGPVQFSGADRTGIINVNQHIGNTSTWIGQFSPDTHKNVSDRLTLYEEVLKWRTSDGLRPSDGTPMPRKCNVESFRQLLGVECETAIIVLNIIGISGFILLTVITVIVIKRRYDKKMRLFKQQNGRYSEYSWPALDKWEIAKDRVVLNRKLGEGAFGTVYGGEALIGDSWVAVAVKTLKVGSNTEEKLDFLSEAEMMKQFNHKNIVKLLGVCTRNEPVYAVMEFMLHGDLKTYLLSRRQLVGQNTKEAEDVSAEGLTKMALDVAYGLQYLSENKYVHRDLACRNCLVHADKAVKIGDFGMARLTYDSDYYRFNKRGMFPVRWMAPESLSDGIFRSSSDVWSYGILLYEIMTFGSFPYQGLSNRQVLNFVKNGHTITLPQACPPKLDELVRCCWNLDPNRRPTIDSIIELLEQSPTLIRPCLDVPSSAVALEGTASLEMSLGPTKPRTVRNSHARRPSGGDMWLQRRGLSMSSSHGGGVSVGGGVGDEDSKLSLGVEYSPTDAVMVSLMDSFTNAVPSPKPVSELVPRYCKTTSAPHGRVSFDSFVLNSVFGRSLSTDDKRTSALIVTLGCSIDPEIDGSSSAVTLAANADTGSIVCSTESLHRGNDLESINANSTCHHAPTSSLESRTDSDYCSQHSKDFSSNTRTSSCAPFV